MLTINTVAWICHEANRALCASMLDDSQPAWKDAPQWQVESALKGVKFCLDNPAAPPSANHESWLKQKLEDGWKYGPVKDPETKEHPCCVPYEQLPEDQKAKDYLFKGIVVGLSSITENVEPKLCRVKTIGLVVLTNDKVSTGQAERESRCNSGQPFKYGCGGIRH